MEPEGPKKTISHLFGIPNAPGACMHFYPFTWYFKGSQTIPKTMIKQPPNRQATGHFGASSMCMYMHRSTHIYIHIYTYIYTNILLLFFYFQSPWRQSQQCRDRTIVQPHRWADGPGFAPSTRHHPPKNTSSTEKILRPLFIR